MNQRAQTMAHLAQALAPEDVTLIRIALQEYRDRWASTDHSSTVRAEELAELMRGVNLSRNALGPADAALVLHEDERRLMIYLATAHDDGDPVAARIVRKLEA